MASMSRSLSGLLANVSCSRSKPAGRWSLQRRRLHVGKVGLRITLRPFLIFATNMASKTLEQNLRGGPTQRNLSLCSCWKVALDKKDIGILLLRLKEHAYSSAKRFVTSRHRMDGQIARTFGMQAHSSLCQLSLSRSLSAAGREIRNHQRRAFRSGCILSTRTLTEKTKTEFGENSPKRKSLRSAARHFPRRTIRL